MCRLAKPTDTSARTAYATRAFRRSSSSAVSQVSARVPVPAPPEGASLLHAARGKCQLPFTVLTRASHWCALNEELTSHLSSINDHHQTTARSGARIDTMIVPILDFSALGSVNQATFNCGALISPAKASQLEEPNWAPR